MGRSAIFRPSRGFAILAVLALHAVVLMMMLRPEAPRPDTPGRNPPLQLVFLPPLKAPKMLADTVRPKHLSADLGISIAPPTLEGLLPPAPASQANGAGAGVNWNAEARRALMAYEIRRERGVEHSALGLTPWDGWLPERQQRPGGRLRTESGDWIVWINGSCYQIASWYRGDGQELPDAPPTFCVDGHGAAHPASVQPSAAPTH